MFGENAPDWMCLTSPGFRGIAAREKDDLVTLRSFCVEKKISCRLVQCIVKEHQDEIPFNLVDNVKRYDYDLIYHIWRKYGPPKRSIVESEANEILPYPKRIGSYLAPVWERFGSKYYRFEDVMMLNTQLRADGMEAAIKKRATNGSAYRHYRKTKVA